MEPTTALVHTDPQVQQVSWVHLSSLPIRAAARDVSHLHELEHAGESEWTPWIALAGLILFFASAGMLMFGVVEAASRLLT